MEVHFPVSFTERLVWAIWAMAVGYAVSIFMTHVTAPREPRMIIRQAAPVPPVRGIMHRKQQFQHNGQQRNRWLS
jgi:hypothetical protein